MLATTRKGSLRRCNGVDRVAEEVSAADAICVRAGLGGLADLGLQLAGAGCLVREGPGRGTGTGTDGRASIIKQSKQKECGGHDPGNTCTGNTE